MTLPSWWQQAKSVLAPVPIPLWAAIIWAESGGNPTASNVKPPDDSHGLFQLNRNGGQGAGYTVEQLENPLFNLGVGRMAVARAYLEVNGGEHPLSQNEVEQIAIRSGHPGPVPATDPRIQRIVSLWTAAASVQAQGDEAMVQAMGGVTEGQTPAQAAAGAAAAAGNPVGAAVADAIGGVVAGIGTNLQAWFQEHHAILTAAGLGLIFIAVGAAGIASSGAREA